MSAAERLAAALDGLRIDGPLGVARMREGHEEYVDAFLAADPTLAQDIEDGRALRELREALPTSGYRFVEVRTEEGGEVAVTFYDSGAEFIGYGPTIAAAADACREALR